MTLMFIIAGIFLALIVGLWVIRRIKKAAGLPVIGDGHLIKEWLERRRRPKPKGDTTPK